MSVHAKRTAGIISLMVGGSEVTARGDFEYRLSGWQNEPIPNANGTVSIGGKWVEGYIKGTVANYRDTDLKALKDAEGQDIQLRTGNGKIIIAKDAFQVDESANSVDSGQFPIHFASDNVEEVR